MNIPQTLTRCITYIEELADGYYSDLLVLFFDTNEINLSEKHKFKWLNTNMLYLLLNSIALKSFYFHTGNGIKTSSNQKTNLH